MNYVCTIGFFDGVHRGHQYLLRQLLSEGMRRGMGTRVCTFSEHPRKVLQADFRPQLLTTLEEKRALIAAAGIDDCRVLDFNSRMAAMTAAEFMERILVPEGVKMLLMGYDHHFGSDRADFSRCQREGERLGIEVVEESPWSETGVVVSSSLVRSLLSEGKVKEAYELLGRPYTLSGRVVAGHHVGRGLGFPTANLNPDAQEKLIPACGAYAVRCDVEGETHIGMTNIGTRPTLQNGQDMSIETHLFDFHADIYERPLTLHFLHHLRAERQFNNTDELKAQLAVDAEEAKKLLKP
ncbi:MAG: riboflavin biosynthesis protein RibF [Alloprevotella sp.]|nr:riboflavin biosynthesis protein RibF [Alloprevotella sp.]